MIKNIAGLKFGRLSAIHHDGFDKHGNARWQCQCDCGSLYVANGNALRSGKTKSCGCLSFDVASAMNLIHGHTAKRGGNKSPTYRTWRSMINRCYRDKEDSYRFYGGKGIKVCERWRSSFSSFLVDMGERPDGCTIDRKDSNGNYELDNCRWADAKTQANNKGMQKNNTSGYKNVHWRKNRWIVILFLDGQSKYFGSYTDLDRAGKAAADARHNYQGLVASP